MPRLFVTSADQIRLSVATFNRDALASPRNVDLAYKLVRQTSYWVLDSATGLFGPSKFVGYADMTFDAYAASLAGELPGDRFDGHWTQRVIAGVVGPYAASSATEQELIRWASHLLGPLVFRGIKSDKWAFTALP